MLGTATKGGARKVHGPILCVLNRSTQSTWRNYEGRTTFSCFIIASFPPVNNLFPVHAEYDHMCSYSSPLTPVLWPRMVLNYQQLKQVLGLFTKRWRAWLNFWISGAASCLAWLEGGHNMIYECGICLGFFYSENLWFLSLQHFLFQKWNADFLWDGERAR